MFKIIDKINHNIYSCYDEIEQGFLLDDILQKKEFIYNWVEYQIIHNKKNIIIDYKK